MQVVEIPRYVDSQWQVFFWEIDETVPFIFMFSVGILLETTLYATLIGAWMTWQFSRFKRSRLDGVILHVAYWFGVLSLNRKFKNGLIRELIR